jgi:hypothetical protein
VYSLKLIPHEQEATKKHAIRQKEKLRNRPTQLGSKNKE